MLYTLIRSIGAKRLTNVKKVDKLSAFVSSMGFLAKRVCNWTSQRNLSSTTVDFILHHTLSHRVHYLAHVARVGHILLQAGHLTPSHTTPHLDTTPHSEQNTSAALLHLVDLIVSISSLFSCASFV